MLKRLMLTALCLLPVALPAAAQSSIQIRPHHSPRPPGEASAAVMPGFELVQTVPAQTTLARPGVREPLAVWRELFDGAKKEIVLAHFYIAGKPGEAFDGVIDSLANAGKRGVKIRFLMEERGKFAADAATIERVRQIPNLEFRFIEFGKVAANGIIHAKYLVVDGKTAFVGSQNFDWRAFAHIHETGLRIADPVIVGQVQAIFEHDWQAQALIAAGKPVAPLNTTRPQADTARGAWLVASPWAHNPAGVADSESELLRLLASAKTEVRVQLLDYTPLGYGPNRTRPYYDTIDRAVRAMAARGVKFKLLISHWNTEHLALPYLKSLAMLPNVEIRIATIPQIPGADIPFARVIHSKTMSIDGEIAWVGTSNWAGGYFDNSRNLEVVVRDATLAGQVAATHEAIWQSAYTAPLDVNKDYPAPKK